MSHYRSHVYTEADYQDWIASLGSHDCMLNQNIDMKWAVYQFVPPRSFRAVAFALDTLHEAIDAAEEAGLTIQAVNPKRKIGVLEGPSRFVPSHEDQRE